MAPLCAVEHAACLLAQGAARRCWDSFSDDIAMAIRAEMPIRIRLPEVTMPVSAGKHERTTAVAIDHLLSRSSAQHEPLALP